MEACHDLKRYRVQDLFSLITTIRSYTNACKSSSELTVSMNKLTTIDWCWQQRGEIELSLLDKLKYRGLHLLWEMRPSLSVMTASSLHISVSYYFSSWFVFNCTHRFRNKSATCRHRPAPPRPSHHRRPVQSRPSPPLDATAPPRPSWRRRPDLGFFLRLGFIFLIPVY
jgi:hypothetical protein